MGVFALLSILLFGIIIFVEAFRKKTGSYIDFLLPVNVMFIVLFCVIPPFLLFTDLGVNNTGWHWIFKNPLDDITFLLASLVSLFGYLAVILGYFFKSIGYRGAGVTSYSTGAIELAKKGRVIQDKYLLLAAIALGSIGSFSLFFYAHSIGGVSVMIELAPTFRSDEPAYISRYAFLKNVAPLVVVSSYFFFALGQVAEANAIRYFSRFLFIIMLFLSLLLLFHQSGRLHLLAYVLIFPMAIMIRNNRLSPKFVLIGLIMFIFMTLLGKELFHYFIHPESLSNKITNVSANPSNALSEVLMEFTFPYVTLANAISVVPTEVEYRWFIDIPISIIHILPQRLLGLENLPPTVTMVNVEQFNAPIPVDLISFGYFSMGFAGVLILCFVYGLLLNYFDRLLPASGEPVFVIFRAAWIMFFAFNVMYGNPHHALETGFSLFVATAILGVVTRCRISSKAV